jgi:hypothetical protein
VMGFVLARFGDRSLALFLLHPIVLHFLAEVLYRLRLNLWLFGREDQYGPLAPKPKHAIVP